MISGGAQGRERVWRRENIKFAFKEGFGEAAIRACFFVWKDVRQGENNIKKKY